MDPPPQQLDLSEGITLSKDQLKGNESFYFFWTVSTLKVYILLVLRKAFDAFDTEKKGKITCDSINTILDMLGHATDAVTVRNIVAEIDHQGMYHLVVCN